MTDGGGRRREWSGAGNGSGGKKILDGCLHRDKRLLRLSVGVRALMGG